MESRPVLGLVLPCFNEEAVLLHTHERLQVALRGLVGKQLISGQSFIVYVDDGSRDGTWELVKRLTASGDDVGTFGLRLSRNFGQQAALFAGLMEYADRADCLVSMDADLQDDLGVLEDMVRQHQLGAEIVYGVRSDRQSDTAFKRFTARLYYSLMRHLGVDMVPDHADFRLASRQALEALKQFGEVNLFLRGLFPSLGFRTATVSYVRKPRQFGATKYPLKKMLLFALDGLTSFSIVPLRLIALSGAVVFLASLLMGAWALYLWVAHKSIQGWASTVLPLYVLGGVQLMSTGILGEYLGRIYQETKKRPRYLVAERLGQSQIDAQPKT